MYEIIVAVNNEFADKNPITRSFPAETSQSKVHRLGIHPAKGAHGRGSRRD
jgi:hypothetical protein